MRLFKCCMASLTLLAVSGAQAADSKASPYVALDAFAAQHEERVDGADNKTAFGGRLGVGFPLFDSPGGATFLEVGAFTNPFEYEQPAARESQLGFMLDLVSEFDLGMVDPYIFAGGGRLKERAIGTEGTYTALEGGLGVAFTVIEQLKVRAGLAAMLIENDRVNPRQDSFLDYRFNVGLLLPFGEAPRPPPPPAPPADTDGDGLVDTKDRCPTQAASTPDGCPAPIVPAAPKRDSDNDGIDDAVDTCPDTLKGLQVDARGCVADTATPQSVVLKGVNFLPNSAELTPDAKKVLQDAYEALAGDKNLKVEIAGHTDALGEDAFNMTLSQKRAESVRAFLMSKGIEGGRLAAKGYGETQPVADNKTKAGRSQNRRVELKVQ